MDNPNTLTQLMGLEPKDLVLLALIALGAMAHVAHAVRVTLVVAGNAH